jgi:glycosyltransferase involved in cell wall biosynthesis
MRYVWDLQDQYLREAGLDLGIKGAVVKHILGMIRDWDYKIAQQVDHFIANSHYIQDRIKRCYGRDSTVIYPPVDVDAFKLHENKDNYFLAASRMVSYKKMGMIVEAFSENGLPLVIIGDGPDLEKIKRGAKKNIEFLGFIDCNALIEYMQKARAFIFAAEEDFGIVPVEAQACGTPVIAYGKGGVTETVIPIQQSAVSGQGSSNAGAYGSTPTVKDRNPTGVFFYEQTVPSLIDAVKKFIAAEDSFNPLGIRNNAERFSIERFKKEFQDFVNHKIKSFHRD